MSSTLSTEIRKLCIQRHWVGYIPFHFAGANSVCDGDDAPRYFYEYNRIYVSLGWLQATSPETYSMAVAELLTGTLVFASIGA